MPVVTFVRSIPDHPIVGCRGDRGDALGNVLADALGDALGSALAANV